MSGAPLREMTGRIRCLRSSRRLRPVRHRLRPGSLLRPGRQQRLDQHPQDVIHDPCRALTPTRTAESSHRSRPTRAPQQDRVTSSHGLQELSRRHPQTKVCPSTHGVVTGERRAVKVAWVVRAEDRGERTCSAGTSPTAHQYHLENLTDAVEKTVNQHHARLRDHGEPDKPQSVPPLDPKGLGHTVTAGRDGRGGSRTGCMNSTRAPA